LHLREVERRDSESWGVFVAGLSFEERERLIERLSKSINRRRLGG